MKKILTGIAALAFLAGCSKYIQDTNTAGCDLRVELNQAHQKKDTVERLVREYVKLGVPGIVVAIYSPAQGYWGTAAGLAKIETKTSMELCQLQYLQSISKIYMAVAVLKLYEEGKVNLDAPITDYLPQRYSSCINQAATITVRNLMNHTSGIPEYSFAPGYIACLLQHPDHSFTTEEFLSYIKNKKLQFKPGSKFDYCNTNYHLLALIADAVAGDHAKLVRDKVFAPAGLSNTFYRGQQDYLREPTLVNSYLDRFSTGLVENVSQMQQVSVGCSKGDDGIIATPFDAISFLKSLVRGQLLSPNTMKQMTTWVNDGEGKPVYGLGLYHVVYGGEAGYGHGGAGIGAGCGLYYFPGKQLYIFLGTNIGTLIDGPIVKKVNELKYKLLELLSGD